MRIQWLEPGRASTRLAGFFEGRRGEFLSGWTFDPAAPHRPLTVQLIGSNGERAQVVADRHRADVQRAGHGDGYSGFRVPLAPFAAARSVECRWLGNGRRLTGSPQLLSSPQPALVHSCGPWQLYLDAEVRGAARLSGHIADPQQPYRRALLGLFNGAALVATQRACLYHPDARIAGGDGFNGFTLFAPRSGMNLSLVDLDRQLPLLRLRR